MLGLYSKKDVEKLVDRLREEYEEALRTQRQAAEELKEENRNLAARVSQLEAERATVADALIDAVKAGERIRKESEDAAANGGKELSLLIAKCRLLSGNLMAKYPDAEDIKAFSDFVEALQSEASEEEDVLDMDEVLAPKYPLDLGKLCKELGLMEDKEQETEEA